MKTLLIAVALLAISGTANAASECRTYTTGERFKYFQNGFNSGYKNGRPMTREESLVTDPALLAEFERIGAMSPEEQAARVACFPKMTNAEYAYWTDRRIKRQERLARAPVVQREVYTSKTAPKSVGKAVGEIVGGMSEMAGEIAYELADEPLAWAALAFFLFSNPLGWIVLIIVVVVFFKLLSGLLGGLSSACGKTGEAK